MYTRMAKCHISFCVKSFQVIRTNKGRVRVMHSSTSSLLLCQAVKNTWGRTQDCQHTQRSLRWEHSHRKPVGSGGVPSATGYCLRVKCCVQTGRISPAATSPRNHTALCPGFLKSPVAVACVPQVIKARTRALCKILAQGTRADATQAPRCIRTGRRAPPCLAKQG